jgi:hypothetical protein
MAMRRLPRVLLNTQLMTIVSGMTLKVNTATARTLNPPFCAAQPGMRYCG